MQLASAGGRYRLACGPGDPGYVAYPTSGSVGPYSYLYQCALNQVPFVPGQPELRFAILDPAGVAVSHDAGQHWIPLMAASPVDRPYAAFYDSIPHSACSTCPSMTSLFVALHGGGVFRIDAPFATLSPPQSRMPTPRPSSREQLAVVLIGKVRSGKRPVRAG